MREQDEEENQCIDGSEEPEDLFYWKLKDWQARLEIRRELVVNQTKDFLGL